MLKEFDHFLVDHPFNPKLKGFKRFVIEFWFFGLKEARSCLFAAVIFLSMMVIPKTGIFNIPRYDILLIIALFTQILMVFFKLETLGEVLAITIFHLIGFGLEVFKTSSSIGSWSYESFAYTKVFNVPLFTGFMYASVGSYLIQAWHLLDCKLNKNPPYMVSIALATLIYINFFSHHYLGDYRWYLVALTFVVYARSSIDFKPYDKTRKIPMLLAFILIGFFVWIAENFSTFFGIWTYPNQTKAWSLVHIGKWSSWALLVIMSFSIVSYYEYLISKKSK